MNYDEAFDSATFWNLEKGGEPQFIVKLHSSGEYVRCANPKSWPRATLIGEVRRMTPR